MSKTNTHGGPRGGGRPPKHTEAKRPFSARLTPTALAALESLPGSSNSDRLENLLRPATDDIGKALRIAAAMVEAVPTETWVVSLFEDAARDALEWLPRKTAAESVDILRALALRFNVNYWDFDLEAGGNA